MENMIQALEVYFKETPIEKVMEDWEKTKEWDDVSITVTDFVEESLMLNTDLKQVSDFKEICNSLPPLVVASDNLIHDIGKVAVRGLAK
jgi:hypothetical protein